MISHRYCLIIGAMKAGTTQLFNIVSSCKGVSSSRIKDTRFFVSADEGGNWERGLGWYNLQFVGASSIRMEASTQYTKWPDKSGVPERIQSLIPDPLLVYSIRHPVDRAISHYFHNCVVDGNWADINKVLYNKQTKYYIYSDYALQLDQYLKVFPLDNFVFVEPTRREGGNKHVRELLRKLRLDSTYQSKLKINSIREIIKEKNCREKDWQNDQICDQFDFLRRLVLGEFISDPRNLALRYGLQATVLKKLSKILYRRSLEFSKLTGFSVDHWWDQSESYF